MFRKRYTFIFYPLTTAVCVGFYAGYQNFFKGGGSTVTFIIVTNNAMQLTHKNNASALMTTVLVTVLTATILLALEYIQLSARQNCCEINLNNILRVFTGRFQLMNMQ